MELPAYTASYRHTLLTCTHINPQHMHEAYCSRSVCAITTLAATYVVYTLKSGGHYSFEGFSRCEFIENTLFTVDSITLLN